MVFSSLIFLYLFLPIALLGHFSLPLRLRNAWLLACSLSFYAWGEGWFVLVMLAGIAFNYIAAFVIQAYAPGTRRRSIALSVAVLLDLLPLIFFKYTRFIIANISAALAPFGCDIPTIEGIHLPIGISFFTFQGISYLVDVSRGDIAAQRDPIAYGAYKSMFPQLIAGPIVRYRDIAGALDSRRAALADVAGGIERFVIGLGKKVLLADLVAIPADRAFALGPDHLTTGIAWLGASCYMLQIYLDFSAYSDMAIGLGRMLGFTFPENFAYPYAATSMRDFWRRWHISLSTWFRDYVYVPLGGGRDGTGRTMRNLFTVFVLCGLWHGAQWTFLLWGLWHGAFLAVEHGMRDKPLRPSFPMTLRHVYVLAVTLAGWVLFRADTLPQAFGFYRAMAGYGALDDGGVLAEAASRDVIAAAIIGTAAAIGALPYLKERISGIRISGMSASDASGIASAMGRAARLIGIGTACTGCIVGHAYSPFIYFRF